MLLKQTFSGRERPVFITTAAGLLSYSYIRYILQKFNNTEQCLRYFESLMFI